MDLSIIDREIERIDGEILRLQGMKEGMLRGRAILLKSEEPPRRMQGLKARILALVISANKYGGISAAAVMVNMPDAKRTSVQPILSRLKAEGMLNFDGERYSASR